MEWSAVMQNASRASAVMGSSIPGVEKRAMSTIRAASIASGNARSTRIVTVALHAPGQRDAKGTSACRGSGSEVMFARWVTAAKAFAIGALAAHSNVRLRVRKMMIARAAAEARRAAIAEVASVMRAAMCWARATHVSSRLLADS